MRLFYTVLAAIFIFTSALQAQGHPAVSFEAPTYNQISGSSLQERALNLITSAGMDQYWGRSRVPYLSEFVYKIKRPGQLTQMAELIYAGIEQEYIHRKIIENEDPDIDVVQLIEGMEAYSLDRRLQGMVLTLKERRALLAKKGSQIGDYLVARLRLAQTSPFTDQMKPVVTPELLEIAGRVTTISGYQGFLSAISAINRKPDKLWKLMAEPWLFELITEFTHRGQVSILETSLKRVITKKGIYAEISKMERITVGGIRELRKLARVHYEERMDSGGDIVNEFNTLKVSEFKERLNQLITNPVLDKAKLRHLRFAKFLIKDYNLIITSEHELTKITIHLARVAETRQLREIFELLASTGYVRREMYTSVTIESPETRLAMLNDLRMVGGLTPSTATVVKQAIENGETSLPVALRRFSGSSNLLGIERTAHLLENIYKIRRDINEAPALAQKLLDHLKRVLRPPTQDQWLGAKVYELIPDISSEVAFIGFVRLADLVARDLEYSHGEILGRISNDEFFKMTLKFKKIEQVELLETMARSAVTAKGAYRLLYKMADERPEFYREVRRAIESNLVIVNEGGTVFKRSSLLTVNKFKDIIRRAKNRRAKNACVSVVQ